MTLHEDTKHIIDAAAKSAVPDIAAETAVQNNDARTAPSKRDNLLFTGPAGTNVNDGRVLLIKRWFSKNLQRTQKSVLFFCGYTLEFLLKQKRNI